MHESTSWRVAAAGRLLALAGLLPLGLLQSLAHPLVWLARLGNSRELRVARRNIALCFPELSSADQARLVKTTLLETARGITELPRIWARPPARALRLIRTVHGQQHLQAALAAGRGVLLAAPHFGQWELLNLYLCSQAPMALLYRPPQHREWEPLLLAARGGLGATQIRADAGGVRALFRCLSRRMLVGILPDQRPKGGEGAVAAFFGQPCRSMTLLSRLAHKSAAPVLFGVARRLPAAAGFDLHFFPAPPGIDAADPAIAVAALHRGIEQCVSIAPAQYQWTYKRFALAADGNGEDIYPDCR
ncbi:MAG: lipid A biosynthesis acyltransferase [Lysobacterales bacterium]